MRMWMVNPRLMCRKHLLGEHVELHMFVSGIRRGLNLRGYLEKNLLEPHNITRRHEQLVRELQRRGYRHGSLLPNFDPVRGGRIHRRANLAELARRCKQCRRMQQKPRGHSASKASRSKRRTP
ncbi:MAG: pyrimidine dimer DNA glycosylase/endonuclease V [Terriglobales bacterium]